ncbi:hypothetical protein ACOME3_003035 [Neoechinorhynchus agilis]
MVAIIDVHVDLRETVQAYFSDKMNPIRCVELFSGIGGFRCACEMINLHFETVMSLDVNTAANEVYALNFRPSKKSLVSKTVESLGVDDFTELKADLWMMSPPCQPFTRIGLQHAEKDNRCRGLQHIVHVLEHIPNPPKHILVENVKNFEESSICAHLITALQKRQYITEEYLLSPKKEYLTRV